MPKYSLWLQPDHADHARLQALIDALSARFDSPGFAAHMTLLSPVDGDDESLIPLLHTLALQNRALIATPRAFEFKPVFYQSCTLTLSATPDLSQLRQNAMQVFATKDKRAFEPHISLAYLTPQVAHRSELAPLLPDALLSTPIRLSRFTLMATEGGPMDWQEVLSVDAAI